MHATSVILVRNDTKDAYVNKYVLRRTQDGQLVLDLVERRGSIYDIKHLNTEHSFLAIAKKSYQDPKKQITAKIGEIFEEVAQTESVVVTLNDKNVGKYEPYQIIVFFNNVEVERLRPAEEANPKENELIIQAKGRRRRVFSFRRTIKSTIPDLNKVYPERFPVYAEVKSVAWLDDDTFCKIGGTDVFTQSWADMMLSKLRKLDKRAILYPTLNGEWTSAQVSKDLKVLPFEVYKEVLRGTTATKKFWEWFLEKLPEIEVEYSENSPEGKVISIKHN